MNFKKFAKLFVLFSLMNLVGTVVWAGETTDCEGIADSVTKSLINELPKAEKDNVPKPVKADPVA